MSDFPENRSELRNYILLILSRMAKWTTLARNGRAGYVDVTGPARNSAHGDKDVAGAARRYQHFGFRSRAPRNSEVILLSLRAGSANQVVIAEESFNHGPKVEDLKDGEVAVYDAAGSVLRMFEDGSASFTAKGGGSLTMDKNGAVAVKTPAGQKLTIDAGAGADVVVNGGTKEVARKGDTVTIDAKDSMGGNITVNSAVISSGAAHFKG